MTTIKLPNERVLQLQALADADGLSIADTIGNLINKAIFDGRLTDQLPGWKVERAGSQVHFENLEAGLSKRWTPDIATGVADTLDKMTKPGASSKAVLDLDADLQFERRGVSVKLIDREAGIDIAVARSIASDLANLIRKAASV